MGGLNMKNLYYYNDSYDTVFYSKDKGKYKRLIYFWTVPKSELLEKVLKWMLVFPNRWEGYNPTVKFRLVELKEMPRL
jgi:hypothetical protein